MLTLNRPQFALRAMRYWSEKSVELHVLDGSQEGIAEEALELRCKNVHYHHLPLPYLERARHAIDLVETEYVQLVCDDEFFLVSGLNRCISKLDEDRSLVTVGGRAVGFDFIRGQLSGWSALKELRGYSLDSPSPSVRMFRHMEAYAPSMIYSVSRVEPWKRALKFAVDNPLPFFASPEVLFQLSLSYQGKSEVLPVLTWLRSNEGQVIREGETWLDLRVDAFRWWTNPSNETQKERLARAFVDEFGGGEGFQGAIYESDVLAALQAFAYAHADFHRPLRRRLSEAMEPWIPQRIRLRVKQVLPGRSSEPQLLHPFHSEIDSLEKDGVEVAQNELNEVHDLLRDFYLSGHS